MNSPLVAKLALALRLGLPVPSECAILKSGVGIRGPIDLSLEHGDKLGVYDPPTVMVIEGLIVPTIFSTSSGSALVSSVCSLPGGMRLPELVPGR